ncbi:DUF4403 family protein [Flavisolibacter tropicus]|uniref:DUF4403 family protein n=1 Tax=Flavisolibacter tropicus TaxID=1492898 RepID=UPI00082B3B2A|nr:DUF4403 family protein [Flavisolibacter tropicus]
MINCKSVFTFFVLVFQLAASAQLSKSYLDSLPVSEIDIPISINLKPIFAMAEKQVDTLFTSPNYPNAWVQADCATRYKYRFKRSPFRISATGTTFNLGFTGYYRITGATRACLGGTTITPWTPDCNCGFEEGDRKVNIGFSSTFTLLPNHILNAKIVRQEPQALDKCTVCFWGQDITSLVMDGLKKELDASKKTMETSFGNIDIRPYMQQAWNKLSEVYAVPSIGYFTLNPKALRMERIGAQNDMLSLTIGISATPVVTLIKPQPVQSVVPNLSPAANKDGFNINLEAALQYDSLSKVINGYMAGQRFEMSEGLVNKHVIVKECKVYSDLQDKLALEVDFEGSYKGTVYFTGKPAYNPETKKIELEEFGYDLKTKSFLLKTAKWLFDKRIMSEIQKYTSIDMKSYYDTASKTMNEWLNREWTKGIRGSGSIQDLSLTAVKALPEHLLIRSNCIGKLNILVSQMEFKF